jgi:hypothetical protein
MLKLRMSFDFLPTPENAQQWAVEHIRLSYPDFADSIIAAIPKELWKLSIESGFADGRVYHDFVHFVRTATIPAMHELEDMYQAELNKLKGTHYFRNYLLVLAGLTHDTQRYKFDGNKFTNEAEQYADKFFYKCDEGHLSIDYENADIREKWLIDLCCEATGFNRNAVIDKSSKIQTTGFDEFSSALFAAHIMLNAPIHVRGVNREIIVLGLVACIAATIAFQGKWHINRICTVVSRVLEELKVADYDEVLGDIISAAVIFSNRDVSNFEDGVETFAYYSHEIIQEENYTLSGEYTASDFIQTLAKMRKFYGMFASDEIIKEKVFKQAIFGDNTIPPEFVCVQATNRIKKTLTSAGKYNDIKIISAGIVLAASIINNADNLPLAKIMNEFNRDDFIKTLLKDLQPMEGEDGVIRKMLLHGRESPAHLRGKPRVTFDIKQSPIAAALYFDFVQEGKYRLREMSDKAAAIAAEQSDWKKSLASVFLADISDIIGETKLQSILSRLNFRRVAA